MVEQRLALEISAFAPREHMKVGAGGMHLMCVYVTYPLFDVLELPLGWGVGDAASDPSSEEVGLLLLKHWVSLTEFRIRAGGPRPSSFDELAHRIGRHRARAPEVLVLFLLHMHEDLHDYAGILIAIKALLIGHDMAVKTIQTVIDFALLGLEAKGFGDIRQTASIKLRQVTEKHYPVLLPELQFDLPDGGAGLGGDGRERIFRFLSDVGGEMESPFQ